MIALGERSGDGDVGGAAGVLQDGSAIYITRNTDYEQPGAVSIVDPVTNTVMGTVPVGAGPVTPVVLPDGSAVYVANSGDGTVSVIGKG